MPKETLPLQTLCIVYCDVANSTAILEEAQRGGNATTRMDNHLILWENCLRKWGAIGCKFRGDGWLATFADPMAAVQALAEAWQQGTAADKRDFRMRASVHWGEVSVRSDAEPLGIHANLGSRVLKAAFCDQMLLTGACVEKIQPTLPADWELYSAGRRLARGFSQPIALYGLRLPGMPEPERRAIGSLPNAPDTFIGREREIHALENMILQGGNRLITLLGTGGSGKTRLATETGRENADDFPNGVFFIPLEEAGTMESVLARIVAAFEVHLPSEADPLYVLKTVLEDQQCLLILDNFEQVQEPALALAELRNACPKLHLLVTSREPLDLPGECLFDVSPLSLPAADASFEEIEHAESVALFVQRVKEVNWQFALTPENASDIAALCGTLDGLPLAIELVAGQVRRRPIANLLTLRSELLGLQSRLHGLPERQRSLRAAFDWTYRRLTEDDQNLFAALGIFETPFAVEDVEAVCDKDDAFKSLERLRDKSLVTAMQNETAPTYRLLMPVREYARERLGEPSGSVRRNFLEWYTQRAQNCYEQAFANDGEREALARVRADLENFRSAWRMILTDKADGLLGILGTAVTLFAPLLPRSADIEAWIPKTEAVLTAQNDLHRLYRLFNTKARMAIVRGEYAQAVSYQKRVLEYFTETASLRELADAQSTMAMFAHRAEMWEEAERYAQDARTTAHLTKNLKAEGLALCILANLCLPEKPQETERLAREGLKRFEQVEDRVGKMHAFLALARAAVTQNDLHSAEIQCRAALNECLIMESLLYMARCGEFVGEFYLEQNHPEIGIPLLFSVAEAQRLQGMPLTAQNKIEKEAQNTKPAPLPQAVRAVLDAHLLFAVAVGGE